MAYNPKKLGCWGAGVTGAINNFAYTSDDDAIAAIEAADYLSDAEDYGMVVGSVVLITDSTGGTGMRQCTAISATGGATLDALL